jgi:HK97 family phage major capsid protein
MPVETMQQKRERRNEYARQARNMVDTVKGDNWTADHTSEYDELINKIELVDAEITREQKILDLTAETTIKSVGGNIASEDEGEYNQRALMQKWMRGGDTALSQDEWHAVLNTMSTTTDSEGGYTVQTEVASEIIEALKAFGGMRDVSTIISTSKGNPMSFPTSDYTNEEGEIIAQNQPATDLDPSFGAKSLPVYKYSSKVVTVPFELLQDSEVDIESFVRRVIERRLARITNKHYTIGDGSDKPTGIVEAATVGHTASSVEIDYLDLLELEHSVDPAYRGRARWMFADSTLKQIRKLKDEQERPIFLPSYDAGIRGGVPAELMGYAMTINQDVPALAADGVAKSVLFGDFSGYHIRDVMAMQLFRFTDSAFTKKGQVGFLAWMRTGGNFLDVGGAVKAMIAGYS